MVKKTGLGKGLGALIPDSFESHVDTEGRTLLEIDIHKITPNVLQPRKVFEDKDLVLLSESILRNGIIQPLILREIKEGYEIIAGERRWRAAQLAKLKTVPAIIMNPDEQKLYELALIENIQRVDLNPIEEAMAYRALIDKFDLTQDAVAKTVAKSRSYIANLLRLLQLCPFVLNLVSNGQLSQGHARCLITLNHINQQNIAQKILDEQLSVRQTERLVSKLQNPTVVNANKESTEDLFYKEKAEFLKDVLGTKVSIVQQGNHYRLFIDFYNDDDLSRILDFFKK